MMHPASPQRFWTWLAGTFRPRVALVSIAASLAILLCFIRASLIGYTLNAFRSPRGELPTAIATACYDLVFLAGVTTLFWIALELARNRPRAQRLICAAYAAAAAAILAVAVLNSSVVANLGAPFNYPWLYYSDFLMSKESQEAIRAAFSPRMVFYGAAGVAALFALAAVAYPFFAWLSGWKRTSWGAGALAVPAFAAYFWSSHSFLTLHMWPKGKLANPIVAFASSFSAGLPSIFEMETPYGPEEFLPSGERPAEIDAPTERHAAGIKNALVVVLESVPAEYVETYGGKFPVTPEIARRRGEAMQFSRIYAHAPASNYSLVSLLCSIYAGISHTNLTAENPSVPYPSLAGELSARGLRAAFFSSGDISFQRGDEFLADRGFDLMQDFRKRECAAGPIVNERPDYKDLDGNDDPCTAAEVAEWIRGEPGRPFFAVMWTMMTHFPYYTRGEDVDYGVKDFQLDRFTTTSLNRYLNALREGDRAFGILMEELDKLGIAEDTLVVVVGDHGEAFGRHDQVSHAQKIYDENLRVPLLLINRRIFSGEENAAIGGLIDVAPTVMDLFGHPLPNGWQGRSLFSAQRSPRVYFFAPWTEFLFGYRENDRKMIFNASRNRIEVYDLAADPEETANIAPDHPELAREIPERLAAWVQYQRRMLAPLMDPANNPR